MWENGSTKYPSIKPGHHIGFQYLQAQKKDLNPARDLIFLCFFKLEPIRIIHFLINLRTLFRCPAIRRYVILFFKDTCKKLPDIKYKQHKVTGKKLNRD